jgi:hypothetical protein
MEKVDRHFRQMPAIRGQMAGDPALLTMKGLISRQRRPNENEEHMFRAMDQCVAEWDLGRIEGRISGT